MKERIKKKSFWLTLVGSVVLILQIMGLKLNVPVVNEVVSAVCALLVFLGIITDDVKPQDEGQEDGEDEAHE